MNNQQINTLRKKIDQIDQKIIELLSERMEKVKKVGEIKKQLNIPPHDAKRWQDVLQNRILIASKYGLSEKLVRSIWNSIHDEALVIEKEI